MKWMKCPQNAFLSIFLIVDIVVAHGFVWKYGQTAGRWSMISCPIKYIKLPFYGIYGHIFQMHPHWISDNSWLPGFHRRLQGYTLSQVAWGRKVGPTAGKVSRASSGGVSLKIRRRRNSNIFQWCSSPFFPWKLVVWTHSYPFFQYF